MATLSRLRLKAMATVVGACVLALSAAVPGHADLSITLPGYAKRADAVCLDYRRKVAQLPRFRLSDFPGVLRVARAFLPIAMAANDRFGAIPLPRVKRSLVKLWLHSVYRVPALVKALEI